jgi:hypothetical protein
MTAVKVRQIHQRLRDGHCWQAVVGNRSRVEEALEVEELAYLWVVAGEDYYSQVCLGQPKEIVVEQEQFGPDDV